MRASLFGLLLALLTAVATWPPATALAQTPPLSDERINLLAAADVPAGRSSVVIDVPRNKGRVRALRIVASSGDIAIRHAVIVYGNGQVHFEDRGRPFVLARGERTREIDRRQDERFVDTVELTVEPPRGNVRVEVWAVQSRDGAAASRAADPLPSPPPVAGTPPPDAPRTRGPVVGDRPPASRTVCNPEVCAEVVVLYGTDRRRASVPTAAGSRIAFGAERADEVTLGRAVVSIPAQGRRPKGTWSRPEIDLVVWRIRRQESMARDFTLLGIEALSQDEFVAAARKELQTKSAPRAFVFVHGYNVGFDDAVFRTAQIAHDTGFDGLAMAFSWPSKGAVLDYASDVENASYAARRLQDFLELATVGTGAGEVHIVAHSMGTKPLLTALENIARAGSATRFAEVLLAAPDVLRGPFAEAIRAVRPITRGITLYASDNDRALRLSNLGRPGEAPPIGLIRDGAPPAVVPGVHSVDVSRLNTGGLSFNHSTFAEREDLVNDMAAVFAGGGRQPHERNRLFVRHPAPAPAGEFFWRYTK